jgi:FixJ family two-component response regulator
MSSNSTVFVVDDDECARESVCALVKSIGVACESFASAEEFLDQYALGRAGCLVTDVRMLGISGLELLDRLKELGSSLPVIVITAYSNTRLTVRAMQSGALTLLDKPCRDDDLYDAIRRALMLDDRRRTQVARRREIRERLQQLTPAQRQVLDLVVSGQPNKRIARSLDLSLRTVESRRSEIYRQMKAESLADLVKMVVEAAAKEDDQR